ncbi:MAG: 50S ribosomal protein L9 [Acidimicrobiales bacterium]
MELILRSDVSGLGQRGDIVEVADGYGRNYLMPKGLAIKVTAGAREQAVSMAKSRAVQDAAEREAAEGVATQLAGRTITIAMRAGDEGKLFGSVTAADVVDAVAAQASIEIDRHDLVLETAIKEVGTHEVVVRPHPEVQIPLIVEVTAA